jgi:Ca2+:H+ antiporter
MKISLWKNLVKNPVNYLIPLTIVAVVLNYLDVQPVWILLFSGLAIIPMAGLIGESTEAIAALSSPRLSGLLNATFGNAAELIITIVAIREGLLELVKASITGSILGNLLIVLGLSMLMGGIRNGVQQFDRQKASNDSILLMLSVTALAIPSLFTLSSQGINNFNDVEILSLGVSGLMIVLYALGIFYSFRVQTGPLSRMSAEGFVHHPGWSMRFSIGMLVFATLGVVILSEILVGQVEATIETLGISEFFLGIIIVPIIGNVAEHLVAVSVAIRNRMSLSVEIAVGSSLQIALFVAPVLVFISLALGNPLTLVFNPFEMIALIGAVLITALVANDGEANWLEGAVLVALYLMLALAFFLLH